MTSRFVAGQTLEDALAVGRKVSREGLMLTLDHLGESVSSPEEAEASRYAYLDAIERNGSGINVGVLIGHTPLRLYVMGEDATERQATVA